MAGETFIICIKESRDASELIDQEKIKTMIHMGNDGEAKSIASKVEREGLFAGETEES